MPLLKMGVRCREHMLKNYDIFIGITPLHIAMMNDDKPCIDLLLRHGADPKILVS